MFNHLNALACHYAAQPEILYGAENPVGYSLLRGFIESLRLFRGHRKAYKLVRCFVARSPPQLFRALRDLLRCVFGHDRRRQIVFGEKLFADRFAYRGGKRGLTLGDNAGGKRQPPFTYFFGIVRSEKHFDRKPVGKIPYNRAE